MCTKTLLFALLCLLLATVNSKTMFSGRGFETPTSIKRSFITNTITFTTQNEDNTRSIGGNGKKSDVMNFLKWKLKFMS